MGLFHRMSRVVTANLNGLVDQLEDPERMLHQAIREMEQTVSEAMQGATRVVAAEKLSSRQLVQQQQEVERWRAQAEQAVRDGDDRRAREALRFKLEYEKMAEALVGQLELIQARRERFRRQIAAMRAKLSEAKARLAGVSAFRRTQHFCNPCEPFLTAAAYGVDDRFRQIYDRVELEELQLDASEELAEEWLDVPSLHCDVVEQELTKLKQELGDAEG